MGRSILLTSRESLTGLHTYSKTVMHACGLRSDVLYIRCVLMDPTTPQGRFWETEDGLKDTKNQSVPKPVTEYILRIVALANPGEASKQDLRLTDAVSAEFSPFE